MNRKKHAFLLGVSWIFLKLGSVLIGWCGKVCVLALERMQVFVLPNRVISEFYGHFGRESGLVQTFCESCIHFIYPSSSLWGLWLRLSYQTFKVMKETTCSNNNNILFEHLRFSLLGQTWVCIHLTKRPALLTNMFAWFLINCSHLPIVLWYKG